MKIENLLKPELKNLYGTRPHVTGSWIRPDYMYLVIE